DEIGPGQPRLGLEALLQRAVGSRAHLARNMEPAHLALDQGAMAVARERLADRLRIEQMQHGHLLAPGSTRRSLFIQCRTIGTLRARSMWSAGGSPGAQPPGSSPKPRSPSGW